MNLDEKFYRCYVTYHENGSNSVFKEEVSAETKMYSLDEEVEFSLNNDLKILYLMKSIKCNIIHIHNKHCK